MASSGLITCNGSNGLAPRESSVDDGIREAGMSCEIRIAHMNITSKTDIVTIMKSKPTPIVCPDSRSQKTRTQRKADSLSSRTLLHHSVIMAGKPRNSFHCRLSGGDVNQPQSMFLAIANRQGTYRNALTASRLETAICAVGEENVTIAGRIRGFMWEY